jgi:hypothetical protein
MNSLLHKKLYKFTPTHCYKKEGPDDINRLTESHKGCVECSVRYRVNDITKSECCTSKTNGWTLFYAISPCFYIRSNVPHINPVHLPFAAPINNFGKWIISVTIPLFLIRISQQKRYSVSLYLLTLWY